MVRKTQTTFILVSIIIGLMMFGLATVFANPGGISTLGDFVWFDEDGDGYKDGITEWGDYGIDGVLVNLYLDDGDRVFEPGTDDELRKSMTTGDNPGTPGKEHGWYDFTELGDHLGWWVEIADSNFEHGGPLEGYTYTGDLGLDPYSGSEPRYVYIPDTLTDYNYADFGYTLKDIVSVGNLVWYDPDDDGKYEPGDGEKGINGITVYLFQDANGNGIPEPGGADGDAIADTETASMTIDGETHDGIYQFLNVTPSTSGDPTTYYFVAVSSADLSALGYTQSSTGYSPDPLFSEDTDDGYPLIEGLRALSDAPRDITASTYVVSNPFPLTVGGQSASLAATDWGDAVGYADSSSYMTVDFGFFQSGPTAVTLASARAASTPAGPGVSLILFGLVGLGAFAWKRRR